MKYVVVVLVLTGWLEAQDIPLALAAPPATAPGQAGPASAPPELVARSPSPQPAPLPAAAEETQPDKTESEYPLPSATAITEQNRREHYLRRQFSPGTFLRAGVAASMAQWRDRPTEWGDDAAGFGRRYLDRYALLSIRNTIQYGIGTWRGEDFRYRRAPSSRFFTRVGHAMKRSVVVETNQGRETLYVSRIVAAVGAGAISTSWQPASRDGIGRGLMRGVSTIWGDATINVFREFWPDIKRKLHR